MRGAAGALGERLHDPAAEYEQRRTARREKVAELAQRERRLADSRLVLFLAAVGVGVAALATGRFSAVWALLPLFGFAVLVLLHDRAIQARVLAERAVRYYEQGLARLNGEWAGRGNPGEGYRDPEHPYAEDLDLFGKGSLFELLCGAQTRSGEETLAAWLKAPAPADEVRSRQEAVRELADRLDLRERAALLGQDVRQDFQVEDVIRWGEEPPIHVAPWVSYVAYAFSVVTLGGAVFWGLGGKPTLFAAAFVLQFLFAWRAMPAHGEVLHRVEGPARQLLGLGRLLACLEGEEWTSERLRKIRAGLELSGEAPSWRIRRLDTLYGMGQVTHNGILAIFGAMVLWNLHVAIRIERWRVESGRHLKAWLELSGEWESLASLATYAYEHPEDTFPEILEGAPSFEAAGMTHPLLPGAAAVRNDLRLGPNPKLLLVSGSNMSGKSTLLRSVGVNAVLALAGSPVRARSLRLRSVQIGASIRTQDSLQGGISRFYAEILRLRQLVGLAGGEPPLLFLLDEILHGTNSHDRRIGAEAVIRTLVGRGAIGLVTTHDLALARIAEDAALSALNVHFQDDIVDGRMSFDYHLRVGVVEKSNALALMRAVGLDVGDEGISEE